MPKAIPKGHLKRVPLEGTPYKTVTLGADLTLEAGAKLLRVLRENKDILAWGPVDVPGVARETIEYYLMIKIESKPKKQKLRRMSVDRLEDAKIEVAKLLEAGVIREVKHPEWLANLVL